MSDKRISRRELLAGLGVSAAGALLAACAPTPEVVKEEVIVKETVMVEGESVEVTRVVEKDVETVVTAVSEEVDWLHAEDITGMPHTTIRYWFFETPERTTLGQTQVAEFEKMCPNISVLGRQAPKWTDNEALLAYIRAGTQSHVHQSFYHEDVWYITHDVPLPADEMPGFDELSATLLPAANYTWEGRTWSMPWYIGGMAMGYNKKLVEDAGLDPSKPPTIYSEFREWAEALTIPDKQQFIAWAFNDLWHNWIWLGNAFYTAAMGKSDLTDPETDEVVFNNDMYLQVCELWQDLYANEQGTMATFATNPFIGGQVAAQLMFASAHKVIKRDAREDFEYVMGPIPKPDDSPAEGNRTYLFVRNFLLINEIEKKGEEADRMMRAAWEFENYLLSPGQLAADYEAAGDPPAAVDLTTNPLYTNITNDIGGANLIWHVDYTFDEGVMGDMNSPYTIEQDTIHAKMFMNLVLQKVEPAEALKQAEEETRALFK